jgi:hypothetical protein
VLKTLYQGGHLLRRTASTLSLSISLMLLVVTYSHGQRFYDVRFSKLPQDYQLYPRDNHNESVVPVAGIVEQAGWKYISVVVMRNNALFQYKRADIQYVGNEKGLFSTEAKIKAELANYDFRVFLCKDGDSTLIVTRSKVVSGDVYILSGQSNSTGFFGEADTSTFCRTFGKITKNLNNDPYDPADTLWAFSNMHSYNNGVGTMGLEIQKQLTEKSGVPNCLINAGYHWSSAYSHSLRTENNPADLTTGYGRMLYRAQKAGVANAVKAYIFRQGETEAYHEGGNWEGNFDVLYKNLKMDFRNLQKLYVFQIDVIYHPSPVGALIRDYQRRLPDIYSDITSIATVGTTGFDGLHYSREGNRQSGFELSRLMLRDFYGATETRNITSPNLKKAFFQSAEKKTLVLVFDEGQELKYPEPYKHQSGAVLEMKNFFYLNGQAGAVMGGKAEGNRIILDLNGSQNASTLHYLPLFVEKTDANYPFRGPYIANTAGMRAFTFFDVPISAALNTTVLDAKSVGNGQVTLSWKPVAGATGYILERKFGEEADFVAVARVSGSNTNWNDTPGDSPVQIIYRLVAVSDAAESAQPAYAEVAPTLILGTEKDPDAIFSVFPNPAVKGETVTITFVKPETGNMELVNLRGQHITGSSITGSKNTSFTVPRHTSGLHLIHFKSNDRSFTKKLWIR